MGREDHAERLARDETRQALLDSGIPVAHVDQVVDLGFHAAAEAIEKLNAIVFSAADERVSITALGIAIGIAQTRLEALQTAMIKIGTDAGRPVKRFTVGGAAHG
jgi:hypothetical protein